MISSWVTDAGRCRSAVPRQSAPVSPPPMMTTCLPVAVIWFCLDVGSPSDARLPCGRNSMAWWMPASSRPGTGRSRPIVEPVAMTTASYRSRSWSPVMDSPTVTPARKTVPSRRIWSSRRSRCFFSILNSGMP